MKFSYETTSLNFSYLSDTIEAKPEGTLIQEQVILKHDHCPQVLSSLVQFPFIQHFFLHKYCMSVTGKTTDSLRHSDNRSVFFNSTRYFLTFKYTETGHLCLLFVYKLLSLPFSLLFDCPTFCPFIHLPIHPSIIHLSISCPLSFDLSLSC